MPPQQAPATAAAAGAEKRRRAQPPRPDPRRDHARPNGRAPQELIRTLTDEALKGTVTYDKNVDRDHQGGRSNAIDEALSKQLAAIMHHPDFQKLEGTWRGLHYLVMNSRDQRQAARSRC